MRKKLQTKYIACQTAILGKLNDSDAGVYNVSLVL